ncbi:MAG: PAS domain S-box protein [Chthoniobacterales bacterium]
MNKISFPKLTRMDAKLAAFFILIGLLPLLITGSLAFNYASRSLRQQVMSNLQVVADSKAQRIEDYLVSRIVDVTGNSRRPSLLAHLDELSNTFHKDRNSPEYTAAARNAGISFRPYVELNNYDNVLLVDASGDVIFSHFPTAELGANLRTAPYQDTPLGNVFENVSLLLTTEISDYAVDAATGDQKAFVAAPIFKNGLLVGTLMLRINNRELFEIAKDYTGLGETGETVIGRLNGNSIMFMTPTRHDPQAAFRRSISGGVRNGHPLHEAVHGNNGIGQVVDYRGKEVLAAWKYLPTLRCGLVVKLDAAEAFAPIRALSKLYLVLGTAILFLITLLAPLVARYLAAPLRVLAQTTRAFSAGETTRRAHVNSSDEIGDLAAAFNQMADQIQQQLTALSRDRDELEVRVAERTAELLHSNDTLQMQGHVMESMTEAVIVADEDGQIITTNPACDGMFGYERGELIGQNVSVLRDLDEAEGRRVTSETMAAVQHGSSWVGEVIRRRKDGTTFIAQAQISAFELAGKRRFFAVQEDITERKRAEEALGESEQEFRALAESMPQMVWKCRPDGWNVYFNQRWVDYTGLTLEESSGHGWSQPFHPDDRQRATNAWKNATENGAEYNLEVRLRDHLGGYRWFLVRGVPQRDKAGAIRWWFGTCTDMHDVKQASEALRESEEKFRLLADNITDVFWITSPDLTIMHYVSAGYEMIWGRSMESLYARPHQWIETILPEDRDNVLAVFGTLMANEPRVSVEYRIARPDGTVRWVHDRGFQVRDAAGKLVRLTGLASDITERKAIEDKLLQNQSLLRIASKISRVGGWAVTVPDNVVFWSSEVWESLGFQRGEEPSLEESLNLYTPDSREKLGAAIALCATEGTAFDMDAEMKEANGRQIWARIAGEAERDADGIITRVIGAFGDITDRKQAEVKLAYERDLLRTLLDHSPDQIYFKDTQSRFLKAGQTQARLFGAASPDDMVGKTDFDFFSEAHARPAFEDEQEIIRTGEPMIGKVEKEIWPDGRESWCLTTKLPFRDKDGNVIGTFGISKDITAIKLAEKEAAYGHDLLRTLLDHSPDHIYFKDTQSRFIKASEAQARLFGLASSDDMEGKTDFDFFSEEHARPAFEDEQEIIRTGQPLINKMENEVWQDGRESWVLTTKMPFRDKDGEIIGTFGISKDVTALKEAEARLFQSQKLETVGKLAGGIAHEFNSIMTAIIGQSELLLHDLPPGNPLVTNATEIRKAADRAAALTRQLLAYGRKQILRPEILDLNAVLFDREMMLRHLIGQNVDLRLVPGCGLKPVRADVGQIEQVIVNMVLNANAAMPNGGRLTLETSCVALDPNAVSGFPELKPGEFVMLAITDTGIGMSETTRRHIFEPFFSTKGVGQGTGLGLATCYGIIKQSGGHIAVQSLPGEGTSFQIYLPSFAQASSLEVSPAPASPAARGTEAILLVEEDPALREMSGILLGKVGYTVLTAASGQAAWSLAQRPDRGPIHLLVTDMALSGMAGETLAAHVLAHHPGAAVLYTSDQADATGAHGGFLPKPFSPTALMRKIRETLDQSPRP